MIRTQNRDPIVALSHATLELSKGSQALGSSTLKSLLFSMVLPRSHRHFIKKIWTVVVKLLTLTFLIPSFSFCKSLNVSQSFFSTLWALAYYIFLMGHIFLSTHFLYSSSTRGLLFCFWAQALSISIAIYFHFKLYWAANLKSFLTRPAHTNISC